MTNVGIYKITSPSPSNKVYIGQSWNIKRRESIYRLIRNCNQSKIKNSLLKYGFNAHKFEIIHELPIDITQEVMDAYEALYMSQYKECGFELMNIREAGSRGKFNSSETISKMKESAIKRGNNLPLGFKHSEETKLRFSDLFKGRESWNNGKKTKNETKQKQRLAKLGKIGSACPNSKKVICSLTGIIYSSIGEASKALNIRRTTLNAYLTGQLKSKTTLKYLYE